MGKFVYIYKKNQNNWEHHLKVIKNILGDEKDTYSKQTSDQLIWVGGASGLKINDFSLITGILDKETLVDSKYYSFKMTVNDDNIELKADLCASRTVWYVIDNEQLIVSSSQRAIITLLGNYIKNTQAASWMLTTGSLGPGNSWDKRIRHLSPSQKCIFEKETFLIKKDLINSEVQQTKEDISEIFEDVFEHLPDYDDHVGLTLSGGYDSRAVLYHLIKKNNKIKTFTWGVEGSNTIPKSDSNIACNVAKELGVEFNFLPLDKTAFTPHEIMERFIMHGEGRIDHISAFSDGLKFWDSINRLGINTIVRSDEAFGWIRSTTLKDVRISLDLNMTSDYKNLENILLKSSLPKPEWSEELNRKDETISKYRDRMYKTYRIPFVLSALHDLMLPFVEIVNPLLHPSILQWADLQNDEDRSDKKKYKKYVEQLLREVPFALTPSIPEPENLIKDKKLSEVIIDTLNTQSSYDILGKEFINALLNNFETNKDSKLESSKQRFGKNLLPYAFKKILRNTVMPYNLAYNRIVLRAYIVIKMDEIIRRDISQNQH